MTTWTDVTPSTTGYKGTLKGKLYSGNRGIYAGALTIQIGGTDIDFYAGYIGVGITWEAVTPSEPSWSDVSPGTTTWSDVSPTTTTWNDV